MKGQFGVDVEVASDIFSERNIPEEDREYILKVLKEFNWKSLQRLPERDEEVFFLGAIELIATVGTIWTRVYDGKYYTKKGLWYTVFIRDIEIIQRNS